MTNEHARNVRFDLEMSPETEALLNRWAANHCTTPSQVLSLALALFDLAARAASDDHRVLITDRKGNVIREVVGLIETK